jgi:hypothetical protein
MVMNMRGRKIMSGIGAIAACAAVIGLITASTSTDASAQVAQAPAQDAGPPPLSLPACVGVSTSSRYVPYGYNHVVVLKNGCSKPATCTVATDVNPTPTSVDVATGTTVEVLTFMASASQTFTARVTCKLH